MAAPATGRCGLRVTQGFHGYYGAACLLDCLEVEHGACLAGIVVLRFHGYLREECQCPFRAYHEVGYDVERVVEADERKQVQPRYILNGVFVPDAFRQLLVGAYLVAERTDAAYEVAVRHFECRTAYGVAGIEHRAVCQYDAGGEEYFIAVGMCAAVHAGGVVHNDAAYHGAFYGSRVWGEFPSEGRQQLIDPLPGNAGLQGDFLVVGRQAVLLPVFAGYDKYGVADCLSGQAGSCRPEGDGQVVAACQFQQAGDFFFALRTDYDLRDEAVEACIRTPSQPAEFVGVNPFLRDEPCCFMQESHVVALFHNVYTFYSCAASRLPSLQ